ncbi:hypothetical protein Tco_0764041 [Tanacetum coccineum]
MVFSSPCLTDKKELIHHEVEMDIISNHGIALIGNQRNWLSQTQTAFAEVVLKSVAGSGFPVASSTLLPFDVQIQQICADVSCVKVKTQADWMLLLSLYFNPQVPTGRVVVPTGRYVVPAGRVVVPTGRYVVPAGKVIIIVSPGRLSLVPTRRILSRGKVK